MLRTASRVKKQSANAFEEIITAYRENQMQQAHGVGKMQGVSTLKQMMRIVTTFNGNGKGKSKGVSVQAIKAHIGSRDIAPRILNLGIR